MSIQGLVCVGCCPVLGMALVTSVVNMALSVERVCVEDFCNRYTDDRPGLASLSVMHYSYCFHQGYCTHTHTCMYTE